MATYRPRWRAEIAVPSPNARKETPDASELISIPLKVIRFVLERNDRNHADQCRLTVGWSETGFDPRLLSNGVVSLWIDNADDLGHWDATEENLRFLGIVMECEKRVDGESPPVMEILASDYTSFFLARKPFPTDFIPHRAMNLQQAWQLICDGTGHYDPDQDKIVSSVSALRDALVFSPDITEPPSLSSATSKRFAGSQVSAHPNSDAWAVWQNTVGTLGLLSYIDRDKVWVSSIEGYFTKSDPPVMLTGRNILSWKERRLVQSFANRGVAVIAYDPLLGVTQELLYPPLGDLRVTRKRARAATAKPSKRPAVTTDVRDTFPGPPGVTDPAILGDVARSIYEERSRQELAGTLETAELIVKTRSGDDFSLLDLTHGDDIELNVDDGDRLALVTLPPFLRRQYLKDKGYSDEVAAIMADAAGDPLLRSYRFYVRRVQVEGDADAPSFKISIDYVNKIHLPGVDDGEGTST